MSGVALTSVTLEYGGVGFRSTLVTAANIVMCLPLSESSDIATVAHDIRGLNDGTYVGSGFTRRVTLPIPEGGLGTTFAGAEYVEVLDDGEGVDDPPYQNLSLSLQSGSMDVIFLIKTFTDDATLRCIVQKQETDSSGDGWHVALQNGGIVFTLIVASSTIFSFTRGAIADGDWHLVNCVYKPGGGDDVARIYIDGVASGADVTSVSTEPAFTTANLRVGTFNDGAGDLIGSLAFVTLGRTGDTALPATLDTALDWTDFTVDTNAAAAPLVFELGGDQGGPTDLVAPTGPMTFALKNGPNNSGGVAGYYTPGHSNVRRGWKKGAPIRLTLAYGGTSYYKWRGYLSNVTPLAGQYLSQDAFCTCTDWMDVAASIHTSALPTQVNQNVVDCLGLAIDQTEGRTSAAISLPAGGDTFPYTFDSSEGESEPVLTELSRLLASECGRAYMVGDTVQGGTLKIETRQTRQLITDPAATFSDTMHGLDVECGEGLVNIVRAGFTPRRLGASNTTVLWTLDVSTASQLIAPGQTVVLEASLRDPSDIAVRVGATDIQTPTEGTDYVFTADAGGVGTDLSADMVVTVTAGNSVKVTVKNNSTQLAYPQTLQVRGQPIYYDSPVTVTRPPLHRASAQEFGPNAITLNLPYQSSLETATGIADLVLAMFSSEHPIPRSMTIKANQSATLMTQALTREIGDKIGIAETMTGLALTDGDLNIGSFINSIRGEIHEGNRFQMTWGLTPSTPSGDFWVLDEVGASELDDTTVLGF